MGVSQTASDVAALIERSLGLDSSHFRPCFSETGSTVSCLVHESWLKEIISGNHSNSSKYIHPSSEYERQLMLQPSHAGPYPPWVRVCIKVLRKPTLVGNSTRSISLRSGNQRNGSEFLMDLTVAELMQTVSKDLYRHHWNAALENYSLAMSYLPKSQQKQIDGQQIIRQLVQKVFGLSVIQLGKKEKKERCSDNNPISDTNTYTSQDDSESANELSIAQSNVVPMVCVLETDEAFFFVEPFFRHGLQDISTFSPAVVSHSTSHLLYVIYQALHGLNWFHRHGLPFGKLGLDNIRLDKGLFLYLTTPSFKDLIVIPSLLDQEAEMSLDNVSCSNTTATNSSSSEEVYVEDNASGEDYLSNSDLQKPEHDLVTLVEMWVRDEISNYDYLMALNYFAGRRHGDPNYHPLFPWVTDFTDKDGGYRDLTRSKFRLNKGDNQLDMTYKHALYDTHEGGTTAVAHHVSDVLSDITFHAYLARRTPISVLCEHLRSNWVPNEYPSTMERLYNWTPDECIPQFFSDPTIFKSIHEDLPDLELPPWTLTAQEFIQWHRGVLESDEVSRNLHQWIDLTFGYKLSGKAAVRAKNVCLHLVNKHQEVNNFGVVQLFNKPHPAQSKTTDLLKLTSTQEALSRRFNESIGSGSLQPFSMSAYFKSNFNDSMVSLDSIDDTHGSDLYSVDQTQSSNKTGSDDNAKISEAEKIYLPDDFNPLKLLETYEAIQKFKRQFPVKSEQQNSIERPEVFVDDSALDKLIQHDIEALGCIIVEMVLPDKVRLVSAGLSQEQKVLAIKSLCSSNPKILPRYLRSGVLSMLSLPSSPHTSINSVHSDLHNWNDEDEDSLPSLNTGLMLHPQTGIFPFPAYFRELHSFLVKFTKARLQDRYQCLETPLNSDALPRISLEGMEHCFSNKSEYSTSQIDISAEILPSLLADLDEEGIHLLLYHLEPLFTNYETRLHAFTHLFDTLAQCLGPKLTLKTFVKPLIELCDSRLLQNYEHVVAQSFLSQIIVRFGLETFLAHFVNFVVDAVAFELMLEKTKRAADRISVHSNEGITGGEIESEKSTTKDDSTAKRSLYLTDDEEYGGAPFAPFSDQEDDEYTSRYDDPFDEQNTLSKRLFTCDEEDKHDEQSSGRDVFTNEDDSSQLDDEESVGIEGAFDSASDDKLTDSAVEETTVEDAKQDEVNEKLDEDNKEGVVLEQESIEEQSLMKKDDDDEELKSDEAKSESDTPVESENLEDQAKELEDEEDVGSSRSSSDDDVSGNSAEEFTSNNQSDRPSADVFYQDTKPCSSQDDKGAEQSKEELSPSYVSGIAAESVMWLAPRLGPILTSQYLAKQLLTMLPQCYMDVVGVEEFENEDEDRKAKWVLNCLGNFCALYGEAFVLHQYLPFAEKIIKSINSKITARGEASLAAVFALIKYCVPYMSKETLLDNFETLFKTVFQPVLRILSSWNTKFPGGGDARAALCHNYVDLLTVWSLKLERELARELMTAPLQQFFSCFELVHMKKREINLDSSSFMDVSSSVDDGEGEAKDIPKSPVFEGGIIKPEQIEAFYKTSMYEELCQTFSAAMAHQAYVPLCAIMGSKYMESALYNHDLIWNLCCSHDAQLSHPGNDDVSESRDSLDVQKSGDECDDEVEKVLGEGAKVKNDNEADVEDKSNSLRRAASRRLRTPSWLIGRKAEKRKSQNMGKPEVVSASDQYLRGSWLDHWKYQLQSNTRSRRSRFSLQQIKLQTFTGHSGPVRSIYVQDSEHFFLSASKDKTVKLWSLSNHGDGTAQSASSWTYYRHSRGVFAVDMVESVRQAVSCDGSVHIWDPVHGTTIAVLEPNKNSSVVAMVAMPAPSQSVVVVTSEATARFIDVRQTRFVHEWKTNTSSAAGSVRDLCCSPDGRWIAIGFSSGLVSVIDVRGGLLRSQRRAHTSDVVQVRAFSNNSLFTSSMDQGLSLWKDDGLRLKNLKGHTEPLNLLLVQKDYIISSSIASRVGIHELTDEPSENSYTGYKLLPEVFRGNLTSLGYLQLNQLLLLGGDTGNITLCA